MKKIVLVAAILVLGFSGVSNAALLYQDTGDYWFAPQRPGITEKTWSWTNNVGPLASADLTISFYDIGLDCSV